MVDLTAELEPPQQALVDLVWPVFSAHHQFPVHAHVEYRLRQQGLNITEVLAGFPVIGSDLVYGGGYQAVGRMTSGGSPRPESEVFLTMAGLLHARDERAMQIIEANLAYLRAMTDAQREYAEAFFDVPNIRVSLRQTLAAQGMSPELAQWAGPIAAHEWLGMRVNWRPDLVDADGELGMLTEAHFTTVEDYLHAITAATTPQRKQAVPQLLDPNGLVRALTSFDVTCELVLGAPLLKQPALTRTVWFSQEAATQSDLQSGISALGELLQDLQVPGNGNALNRLLAYLVGKKPNLDQARVQDAIDLLVAVREIRNSGVHPRPAPKLISAHETLGLRFPANDPAAAWRTVRAQMELAFTILQEEIYAAR